jgi:hypothetical protein
MAVKGHIVNPTKYIVILMETDDETMYNTDQIASTLNRLARAVTNNPFGTQLDVVDINGKLLGKLEYMAGKIPVSGEG